MAAPQPKKRNSGRNGGRKPWQPTPEQRMDVEKYAAVGTPHDVIADIMEVCTDTLEKHCAAELKNGSLKINARIAGKLATRALEGDNASIFFWLKTRAGWKETSRHELSGPNGGPIPLKDMSGYSDEQLALLEQAARVLAGTADDDGGESEAVAR